MKNPNEPHTPSQARIDANRENAKKSTGPRTAEGKAASSRNRLLHGLRANKRILLDEDPAEFIVLLHDHLDRFQPVGPAEQDLVLRIAAQQWRLSRSLPMEAGIYRDLFQEVADHDALRQKRYADEVKWADQYNPAPPPPLPPNDGDLPARAFNIDAAGPNALTKLARYETSIERSIDRCLRQLKNYQAARIASTPDPTPEPICPDVEQPVSPAPTPPESTNCHSNPSGAGLQACAGSTEPAPPRAKQTAFATTHMGASNISYRSSWNCNSA